MKRDIDYYARLVIIFIFCFITSELVYLIYLIVIYDALLLFKCVMLSVILAILVCDLFLLYVCIRWGSNDL